MIIEQYGNAQRSVQLRVYGTPGAYRTDLFELAHGERVNAIHEAAGPYASESDAYQTVYNEAEMWCLDNDIEMEEL